MSLQETVGLSMSLHKLAATPLVGSLLPHSYSYETANEPKSALKHPDFSFGPHSSSGF